MKTSRTLLGALVVLAAGCATTSDDSEDASADIVGGDAFGDPTSVFQDDRIGRRLATDLGHVPADLPGLESMFGVGRNCQRRDGKKEIFIVEEKPREADAGDMKLPRGVITGCNTGDPSQASTIRNSYSLMMGVNPDPGAPDAWAGDTMTPSPMEVMALDERTGLFNFYVFEETAKGKPGTVTRFWRSPDGAVMRRRWVGGAAKAEEPAKHEHRACFRCHVDGAPIMNELSEPWTNWISPKKRLPTTGLSGLTKDLVSQASLADQLEGIIRSATQEYVQGKTAGGKAGWLANVRDAALPGKISRLVRPLFCESDLNYLSADTTKGVPEQVFFDPSLTAAAGLPIPDASDGPVPVPFLFPVRSVFDESVQSSLVDAGYVGYDVAVAIRLLDDENDVFSAQRCGVFDDVAKEVDKLGPKPAPSAVASTIKRVVGGKAATLKMTPSRRAYFEARLAEADHEAAQQAYNQELHSRYAALDSKIEPREQRRKALAQKKFPGDVSSSPLPQLDPPR